MEPGDEKRKESRWGVGVACCQPGGHMLQSKPLGQKHPGILSSRPDGTVLLTLSTSTGWEVLAQALN